MNKLQSTLKKILMNENDFELMRIIQACQRSSKNISEMYLIISELEELLDKAHKEFSPAIESDFES